MMGDRGQWGRKVRTSQELLYSSLTSPKRNFFNFPSFY